MTESDKQSQGEALFLFERARDGYKLSVDEWDRIARALNRDGQREIEATKGMSILAGDIRQLRERLRDTEQAGKGLAEAVKLFVDMTERDVKIRERHLITARETLARWEEQR